MKQIFLILKFIQKANLDGQILFRKDFPLEELKVNDDQLDFYLKNLFDDGYIKGLFLIPMYGGKIGIKLNNPTITIKGMEYLEDNSAMKKIYNLFKEGKDIIPPFLAGFF